MFSACGENVPSEQELVANGLSLNEALTSFVELEDNYSYKHKIWQTNGEDWFNYSIVKLNNENIYFQSRYFYGNTGWQIEEDAFTYNPEEKSYIVYAKQNENYIKYRKFKYNDTDEEFMKYSYSYDLSANNNEASGNYFDFSFFNANLFEYYEFDDQNQVLNKVWRVKSSKLIEIAFKTSFFSAFNIECETINDYRIDFAYLFVTNNKVSKILYDYWDGVFQNSYKIEIRFDYENYDINLSNLTTNFVPYIPD